MGKRAALRDELFVGRTAELGILRDALAAAQAGRGRIVLLVGEPGIGKTRLAEAFEGWAGEAGAAVLGGPWRARVLAVGAGAARLRRPARRGEPGGRAGSRGRGHRDHDPGHSRSAAGPRRNGGPPTATRPGSGSSTP